MIACCLSSANNREDNCQQMTLGRHRLAAFNFSVKALAYYSANRYSHWNIPLTSYHYWVFIIGVCVFVDKMRTWISRLPSSLSQKSFLSSNAQGAESKQLPKLDLQPAALEIEDKTLQHPVRLQRRRFSYIHKFKLAKKFGSCVNLWCFT